MKKTLGLVSLLASSVALAAPSNDELQQQIDQLRAQLEATADAVENTAAGSAVSIGGYGELHYNNEQGGDNAIDLHRFVLFIGKELNSTTRFFSEFEVEHSLAGDGKPGEVEIEQAFIEKDINDSLSAKAGLFLIPVGILNETHEPDTFYGVERNNVEKNIVPSTWWEGGAALTIKGETLSYDVALHSGLNIDVVGGKSTPRKGRQKVAKAEANDLAVTARVNYKPAAGISLGATFQYQEDVTQGVASIEGQLIEAHAVVEQGDLSLRALYAQWSFDDKLATFKDGAEKQSGFYLEPAYKVTKDLGVFARYSSYDNLAGNSADTEVNETAFGANYWLAETVVLKLDYNQKDDTASDTTTDTLNLGVGYSF
ncbi:hypothetical protein NBRC116188_28210 [Oceaniserpentilla sp. 4NH20-0058]|uniref:porin n=1 Tax=Oceaniserpentilla sp. 4NH20-0058 TaxID=3127660 RepID=UPI0031025ACF